MHSAAEYVAALHSLRVWSGFSYRQLERQARERGEVLPHSTIAAALARTTLPRADVVASFVRACGAEEDTVASWLSVRQQVATGQFREDSLATLDSGVRADERGAPVPPARSIQRGRLLAAVGGTVTVVVLVALAAEGLFDVRQTPTTTHTSPANPSSAQALVPSGPYRLQMARSGLCLSEQRGSGSGHLYETPCEEQFPSMALRHVVDDIYRVAIDHPQFGPGCMGIPFGSMDTGIEVEDGACGNGAVEEYRWEPVTSPATGYRIRPKHSGMCLGYPADSVIGQDTLRQLPCDSSALGQVFQLQ